MKCGKFVAFMAIFLKQKSHIFSGAHRASGWLHTNVVEHSEPCCSRRTWKHSCYPRHLKLADFFKNKSCMGGLSLCECRVP